MTLLVDTSLSAEGCLFRKLFWSLYDSLNGTARSHTTDIRYDGGVGVNGKKYTCKWNRYATKITSRGLNIQDYLMYVMHNYRIEEPWQAVSEANIAMYIKDTVLPPRIRSRWVWEDKKLADDVQLELLAGYDRDRAFLYVLKKRDPSISALVKYCFGCRNGYAAHLDKLREEAYNEYLRRKLSYDKHCSEWVPAGWSV